MLLSLLSVVATPVIAQAVPDDVVRLSFDPGWREHDGTHVAGLTVHLAPGWKTYWRAPGEGGIPPRFNWSGSQNVEGALVHFPVPEVSVINGIRTIGYTEAVTFPIRFNTKDASLPVQLRGEIELGVCEDICVPITVQFQAELPNKGTASDSLRASMADRPERGGTMRCAISPIADGLRLVATADIPSMGPNEVVVIETSETGVWVSNAVTSRNGGTLTAEVEMVPPNAQPFALSRSNVRLTVLAGGRAVESLGCQ
jgi:DsbC/DsbD-like thiol-disulfide interchange protein